MSASKNSHVASGPQSKTKPARHLCFLGNHHLFTAACVLSAAPTPPPPPFFFPSREFEPLRLWLATRSTALRHEKKASFFLPLPVLFIGTASLNREKREKLLHCQGQRKTCVEGRQRRSLSHNLIMRRWLSLCLREEPSEHVEEHRPSRGKKADRGHSSSPRLHLLC